MRRILGVTSVALSVCRRVACLAALTVLACGPSALAQVGTKGDYQAYRLTYKPVAEVKQMLAEMLSDLGDQTHLVADAQTNQILLRGPSEAQEIARRLIESVDRPPAAGAVVNLPATKSVVQSYPCAADRLDQAAQRLRSMFSASGARIAMDSQTRQLLVLAPPAVHTMVRQELERMGVAARAMPATPPTPATPPQAGPHEQFVPLTHSPIDRIESKLFALIGNRLMRLQRPPTEQPGYALVNAAGERVELTLDRRRNGVMVVGEPSLVAQMARLIHILDDPPKVPGRSIRILPVRKADPAKVREAVEAYRSGRGGVDVPAPEELNGRQSAARPVRRLPDVQQTARRERTTYGGTRLVTHLFRSADESEPSSGNVLAIPTTDIEAVERRLREMGADVDVEALPDLDIIILRGRDQDVDEVARIIEEIERLSAETVPVIDIHPLKYVGGESLVAIIAQVNKDLLGGRQGQVSITPLVKPNALLLIGWGEAVSAIKELIRKLDQPVPPQTQLRVFPLRHAPATSALVTVQGFFTGRTGLGPKALVSADIRTNSLIVQASPRDMAEVQLLIQRLDRPDSEAVSEVRIFPLSNSLAVDLGAVLQAAIDAARGGAFAQKSTTLELLTIDAEGERLLKSGLLGDVEITPDVRTNALIVSAPAGSMELLAALIDQLDSPSSVAQIKVFRVTNGNASAMVEMLRSLLPSANDLPGPQLAGAEGETSLVPVRFSVDTRTNSIIATGSEGDLKIIEALLLRLDEEDEQQRQNTVYRLKNAPAVDVARAINAFLSSERLVQQAVPGVINPFQRIESEVVVVPEPVSNALIISATPRFFDEIMQLVEDLDAEPAQVMIQVLIAEVALGDMDEFGVELGLQDSLLFDRSLLGDLVTTIQTSQNNVGGAIQTSTNEIIQAASNTPGFLFNTPQLGNSGSSLALSQASLVGSQGFSSFGVGRINNELGFGGLVLSASSESISLLIRALQESRRLEVLSRPQIMTLDNQPAFIQIGKRVPRITGSTMRQEGQVNTIEMENVGLILGVTPRISPDGMVVMELDVEKSELGSEAEGIPISIAEGVVIRSPSVNLTMAQTTVSAFDGETIVLGGLITKSMKTINRRVPHLADIPFLGTLFRYDSTIEQRTELLIILTPHIVRSPEDAERIKRVEAARMHWCLGDVNTMHGHTGIYEVGDYAHHGPIQTVYPDLNPRGIPSDELVPTLSEPPVPGEPIEEPPAMGEPRLAPPQPDSPLPPELPSSPLPLPLEEPVGSPQLPLDAIPMPAAAAAAARWPTEATPTGVMPVAYPPAWPDPRQTPSESQSPPPFGPQPPVYPLQQTPLYSPYVPPPAGQYR